MSSISVKKVFLATFFVTVFCFLGISTVSTVSAEQFSRNLKLGDSGPDVLLLQRLLNTNKSTQVAETGVGSLGNETDYFGSLTKSAVIRFQELYRKEVLFPYNLIYGTGFVGVSTRQKLNQISSDLLPSNLSTSATISNVIGNISQTVPSGDFSAVSNQTKDLTQSDSIIPYFPSQYEIFHKNNITITGVGFISKDNIIYFGDNYSLSHIDSPDTQTLTFKLPQELPLGRYDVYVGNNKLISKHATLVVVVDINSKRPVVQSASPSSGIYGTEITITGNNFTSTGNEIRSSYEVLKNLPSADGKTIKIKVLPFPESMQNVEEKPEKVFSWPISFIVINDGGISEKAAIFTLVFE
ncbi:MAG: peptidoglycan-binding protein [Parcubacteria group bacterium]|nr:peptidoglycan-binding protein [Parcubacteria group bacterium]